MCLWKMPPSVNRKFALFAIKKEKSVGLVFNLLILFIFIIFMQNLPQSCTAGLPAAGFWVAGAATFGPSRRARHERRAGGVQMRNSSAERSRPRGGSGGKSASSRKGVFAFHGRLLDPSGSVGAAQPPGLALQASFTEIPAEEADCLLKTPVCPQGARSQREKRAAHEDREQL